MATATKSAAKKSAAKKTAAKKTAVKTAAVKTAAAKTAAAKAAPTKKAATKNAASGTAPPKGAAVQTRLTAASEADPKGGLTAAGRAAFAARDGSHLKPGVTRSEAEMSPEDMKRKGSWAVRFYGRATLPPLVDAKGEPTRFALSAHAWGEPVPKTDAAARRIAEKGRRLLTRYAAALAKAKAKAAKKPVAARKTASAKTAASTG